MYLIETAGNLNSPNDVSRMFEEFKRNEIPIAVIANQNAFDWLSIQREKEVSGCKTKILFSFFRDYKGVKVIWIFKGDVIKSAGILNKALEFNDLELITSMETVPVIVYCDNKRFDEIQNVFEEINEVVGDAYIGITNEDIGKERDFDKKEKEKIVHFQKVDYLIPTDKILRDIKVGRRRELDRYREEFQNYLRPEYYLEREIRESKEFFQKINSHLNFDDRFRLEFWDKKQIEKVGSNINKKRFLEPDVILPEDEWEKRKINLLIEKSVSGFKKRFGTNRNSQGMSDRVRQFKKELTTIVRMGYYEYFLIVEDLVTFSRSKGIRVGARGSVNASLLAYCLNITNIDPLSHNLYFERFLNESRKERPDIDLEFPANKLEKIQNYIYEKYKAENVAKLISFNKYGIRNAINVVRRNFGIEEKIEEWFVGIGSEYKEFKKTPKGRKIIKKIIDDGYGEVLEAAERLSKLPQSRSIQSASLVIDKKISQIPTLNEDGNKSIPFTADNEKLQSIGFEKFDLLPSRNLEILQRTWGYIPKERRRYSLTDKKTFELLSEGKKNFVFQVNSKGMQSAFEKVKPQSIEEIMACISLYRPGPMREIDRYVRNKKTGNYRLVAANGLDIVGSDILDEVLKETKGIIIYQEQIMRIVKIWANFNLEEADVLRSIISSKNEEKMDRVEEVFKKRSGEMGRDPEATNEIFKLIKKFGEYGFPKSHAASYAMYTYETAYLKANYPTEFYLGNLNSNVVSKNNAVLNGIIAEMKTLSYVFKKPNFYKSNGLFKFKNNSIYPGVLTINGITKKEKKEIIKAQKNLRKGELKEKVLKSLLDKISKKGRERLEKEGFFE